MEMFTTVSEEPAASMYPGRRHSVEDHNLKFNFNRCLPIISPSLHETEVELYLTYFPRTIHRANSLYITVQISLTNYVEVLEKLIVTRLAKKFPAFYDSFPCTSFQQQFHSVVSIKKMNLIYFLLVVYI